MTGLLELPAALLDLGVVWVRIKARHEPEMLGTYAACLAVGAIAVSAMPALSFAAFPLFRTQTGRRAWKMARMTVLAATLVYILGLLIATPFIYAQSSAERIIDRLQDRISAQGERITALEGRAVASEDHRKKVEEMQLPSRIASLEERVALLVQLVWGLLAAAALIMVKELMAVYREKIDGRRL